MQNLYIYQQLEQSYEFKTTNIKDYASRAFEFDGVDDYVYVENFEWNSGGPVTVELWVKVNTTDIQENVTFCVGFQENPNRFQVHLPWSDRMLYWDYGNCSRTGGVEIDYTSYLDKWTHIALVSQGKGGRFKGIYLNGTLVASDNISDGPKIPLKKLIIGKWGDLYFKGKIDNFRIWNIVRSQEQICAYMNNRLQGNEPGLVGYWHLDNRLAKDYSHNRNHGTWNGKYCIV
ncbi:LamG domain-containing protein [Nostocaceae cyanobacterium CENA357]|uniref:LamG domain-containing protein n=1 Tax=Atlanticothrix silvestris CENA357 TaxID=1725252 RepID=A0A8J7L592_9CYAN|nr:LamG domain-containing protein [Atlanticothrix silvestris]MBH8552832.1 LamG domain-containing protein [Atlanticothrix silvestris CENA357]